MAIDGPAAFLGVRVEERGGDLKSACRSGDTHIVAGDEGATSLAALLDVPTTDVRAAFATLRQKALIAERGGNIVIDDVSGLEALADA
jgi:hypothetical protein